MINCALCGEILTRPIFIQGKPYGFTCAAKVNWNGVHYKLPGKWVKAESFTKNDINDRAFEIIGFFNGKKYKG